AKLTDGATSVVWMTPLAMSTPGPDSASGLALNGNKVYLAGTVADPTATPQTDGIVAQLDANTGALGPTMSKVGGAFGAGTTASAGNVYVAGSAADASNPDQVDVSFIQLTGDLSSMNYSNEFSQTLSANPANSAVTTGSGLVVDAQGNADFA